MALTGYPLILIEEGAHVSEDELAVVRTGYPDASLIAVNYPSFPRRRGTPPRVTPPPTPA